MMQTNPFPTLKIDSPFFLNDIQGRSICSVCGKSRKFYCYSCYKPLGGKENVEKIPRVKLPVKIDIIKHPQEIDGKSTAVHAAILAPEDVTVYTYPTIPKYTEKVLLVFPCSSAVTFDEYVTKKCRPMDDLQHTEDKNQEDAGEQKAFQPVESVNCEVKVGEKMSSEKMLDIQSDKKRKFDNISAGETALEKDLKTKDPECKKIRHTRYECNFDRVVFIDSTWHSVNKIAFDERLKDLPRIELKAQKTKFWRHQQDKPDTYLATVEAIYYFLVEFHDYFIPTVYSGDYDNLLFYFVFMYDKIRHMFDGGKYIKAFNHNQEDNNTSTEKKS